MIAKLDRAGWVFAFLLIVTAIVVPFLALSPTAAAYHMPSYLVQVLGKIAILVLIILFIQKRPRGLFALKGRAVEA